MESGECRTFYKAIAGTLLPPGPSSLYVGVVRETNVITRLTCSAMSYLTGNITSLHQEECNIMNSDKKVNHKLC